MNNDNTTEDSMTTPPPWADAVADIIDPGAWGYNNVVRAWEVKGLDGGLELSVDEPLGEDLHCYIETQWEHTSPHLSMSREGALRDAADIIRRCYAAALLASGDTEGALRVLGGGDSRSG